MSSNKSKTLKIIAIALCVILSIIAVAGAGAALYLGARNNGWFDKTIVEDDDSVTDENIHSAGEMYVSESTSNGIMLTSVKLLAEEYEEYGISTASVDSAYTLTASYNSGASNPKFTWTSSNTTAVSVTPSSSTISCVVTCNSAFSSAVTITCTAKDNSSVKATCTVGYYKRITDCSFSLVDCSDETCFDSINWSSSNSTVTWKPDSYMATTGDSNIQCSYSTTLGTGTVSDSYTFNSCTLTSNKTGSVYTITSENYRYILSYLTGFSVSLSDSSFLSNVYSALAPYYSVDSPIGTFTLTFTGKNSGVTCSFYYYLIINPLSLV